MFTGIVLGTGKVRSLAAREVGARLWIEAGEIAGGVALGDSVAVDGCCLTAVVKDGSRVAFDAVPETLSRTTLGSKVPGENVNLELALRPQDRMGGHFVQGHVDAVAQILEISPDWMVWIEKPGGFERQIVEKGSVTLDGVSLTVAMVRSDGFAVALIPHTRKVTTLGGRRVGDRLNFEGDVLAKYVAALYAPARPFEPAQTEGR